MSMFNPTSLQVYENKVYYSVLFVKNPCTYYKISNKPLNLNYVNNCDTNGEISDIFQLFQLNTTDFMFNINNIEENSEEKSDKTLNKILQYEFIVFSAHYNNENADNLEQQHKLMRIMSPLIDNPTDSIFIHDYLHESNDIEIIIKKEFNINDLLVNLNDNCTTLTLDDGFCSYDRLDSRQTTVCKLKFNMYPNSIVDTCKSFNLSLPYLNIKILG